MNITLELLALVLDGDGPAIWSLRTMLSPRLAFYKTAYRLTHEDPDDLFQEFIIRLFANGTIEYLLISKHPAPTQVLNSILKQVAIDRLRYWSSGKRDFVRTELLDVEAGDSVEWGAGPHATLAVDLRDLLTTHLSPEELNLIDMLANGELIQGIAQHYSINVSTASRWCIKLGIKVRGLLDGSLLET